MSRSLQAALRQLALLSLALTLSCNSPNEPSETTAATPSLRSGPIVRLVFEDESGKPREDQLVHVARQYHRSSNPTPARFSAQKLPVGDDSCIALGDVVDLDALSADAVGVVFAFHDPIYGPAFTLVPFPDGKSAPNLAATRVNVLPKHMQVLRGRMIDRIDTWAREVGPLPNEHRTVPVLVPEGAQLDFVLLPEQLADDIPRSTATAFRSAPSEPSLQRIRASVLAETKDGRTEIFTQELTSPVLSSEEEFLDQFPEHGGIRRADVSRWAGQRVRFVFSIESADPAGEPVTASWLWANPLLFSPEAAHDFRGPNLLMISLDTLRADHLGCYGYERPTSPNLDAFAENALLFERAMTSAAWTTPSHATVFTGLPPSIHRADNFTMTRLQDRFTTLPEIASARGFLTAAYTEGIAMSGGLGFNQGFDTYSDGFGVPLKSGSAEKIFEQGKQWLDRYGDAPFFLYLHTYEIHAPYEPPEAFRAQFAVTNATRIVPNEQERNEARRTETMNLYDAEIAHTDHVLGDFFAYLEGRGLISSTLIVIFSDHGEEFWEHSGVAHGKTLYQEQLHVPLIIRLPGADPPQARIDRLVGLTDIFATAIDLLGWDAAPPSTSFSLRPLYDLGAGAAYPRTLVSATQRSPRGNTYLVALQSQTEKYIVGARYNDDASPIKHSPEGNIETIEKPLVEYVMQHPGRRAPGPVSELLYDLADDPGELNNVASRDPAQLDAMRTKLLAYLEQLATEPLAHEASEWNPAAPLSARELEEFRALGYLE